MGVVFLVWFCGVGVGGSVDLCGWAGLCCVDVGGYCIWLSWFVVWVVVVGGFGLRVLKGLGCCGWYSW